MFRLIASTALLALTLLAAPQVQAAEITALPQIVPDEVEGLTVKQLEERIAGGDLKAQAELGARYGRGADVPPDLRKAITLIEEAAVKDEANAQYYLGTAYQNGMGVAQDLSRAVIWYEKAASHNHAGAQFALALMITTGQGGLTADPTAAMPYVRKAAEQGFLPAAMRMGLIYQEGLGVDPDPEAAAYWYRRILRGGDHKPAWISLIFLIEQKGVKILPGDPVLPPGGLVELHQKN